MEPMVEPYGPLHGGRIIRGHGALANPDPLRDFVWNLTALPGPNTSLQLASLYPAAVTADPASAFDGTSSLVNSSAGSAHALGAGTLRVDFGVELAAWLELRSPDLTVAAVAAGCVTMSVGEATTPKFFAPSRLVTPCRRAPPAPPGGGPGSRTAMGFLGSSSTRSSMKGYDTGSSTSTLAAARRSHRSRSPRSRHGRRSSPPTGQRSRRQPGRCSSVRGTSADTRSS